jgi:hypothetical protein
MNTGELIAELEKVRDLFEWRLEPHQSRLEPIDRRARPRLRFRGVCKDGPEGTLFEPIGAVCYARTGISYSDDYWLEAALTLHITPEDARDLIAAANDLTWRPVETGREPDPYRQMLRQAMAAAVGLQTEQK